MVKRKTLTVLITILMLSFVAAVFGASGIKAVNADADSPVTVSEGFVYEDDATKTEITGFELPAGVEGEFIVNIPATVTVIGARAFENCENLVGVNFSAGLVTIGDYAFTGAQLVSLTVPKTVTYVGEHSFHGCSALNEVTFEDGRTQRLEIRVSAFERCTGLRTIDLPDNTTVNQLAFGGCSGLLWVYAGKDCVFANSSQGTADMKFFPTNNPSLKIIFPSATAYNAAMNQQDDTTFKTMHAQSSTYIVNVNCHIGADEVKVYERLHGYGFNYVKDENTGYWNTDTASSSLPVQAAHYSATTWYGENALQNKVSVSDVDDLLATQAEINLYCHETISLPELPAKPVSWVQNDKVSYDITDISQVLKAMGCGQSFNEEQLKALDFTVVFADEKGNVAATPKTINGNGVYSVTLSLKPEFGEWSQSVTSTVTVNVNTNGFNTVLIVLIVVGVLAVAVTVSTAIIRKKVLARNKKKNLSQKEILEKFRASGGETDLT